MDESKSIDNQQCDLIKAERGLSILEGVSSLNKKEERRLVFEKTGGKCAYCGCVLTHKSMTVDHIEPIVRPLEFKKGKVVTKNMKGTPEQEDLSNKLPACRSCNSLKGSYSIESFRSLVADLTQSSIRNESKFRTMLRFGLIEVINDPIVFEFEQQGIEVEI